MAQAIRDFAELKDFNEELTPKLSIATLCVSLRNIVLEFEAVIFPVNFFGKKKSLIFFWLNSFLFPEKIKREVSSFVFVPVPVSVSLALR